MEPRERLQLGQWQLARDYFVLLLPVTWKLSGSVVKNLLAMQETCRRCGFDPWVGKILWRGKWQPTPVFLPGESHGQGSLVGCRLWGRTESDTTEATQQQSTSCIVIHIIFCGETHYKMLILVRIPVGFFLG